MIRKFVAASNPRKTFHSPRAADRLARVLRRLADFRLVANRAGVRREDLYECGFEFACEHRLCVS
jgi:hypothetical protein